MTKRKSVVAADVEIVPGESPAPIEPDSLMAVEEPAPMQARNIEDAQPVDVAAFTFLSVRQCSACGGDHDHITLFPLPQSESLDIQHNAYFNCPRTGRRVTITHTGG